MTSFCSLFMLPFFLLLVRIVFGLLCHVSLPLTPYPCTPSPQLMVFQMQFVSLLRMMEANITTPFMNFLDNLKWMNLHFEVDISFLSCDEEVRVCPKTNKLLENGSEKGLSYPEREMS